MSSMILSPPSRRSQLLLAVPIVVVVAAEGVWQCLEVSLLHSDSSHLRNGRGTYLNKQEGEKAWCASQALSVLQMRREPRSGDEGSYCTITQLDATRYKRWGLKLVHLSSFCRRYIEKHGLQPQTWFMLLHVKGQNIAFFFFFWIVHFNLYRIMNDNKYNDRSPKS